MLFNFDEDGNPQVYSKVEDERNAMSLQYLVSHWSDAMEGMNAKSFDENLNNVFGEDREEEEEPELKNAHNAIPMDLLQAIYNQTETAKTVEKQWKT